MLIHMLKYVVFSSISNIKHKFYKLIITNKTMAKLKCNKCNFKWVSRTAVIPRVCPYCGKENCVFDEEETGFKDIDEILSL